MKVGDLIRLKRNGLSKKRSGWATIVEVPHDVNCVKIVYLCNGDYGIVHKTNIGELYEGR